MLLQHCSLNDRIDCLQLALPWAMNRWLCVQLTHWFFRFTATLSFVVHRLFLIGGNEKTNGQGVATVVTIDEKLSVSVTTYLFG
jgi:hypothetical protein